MQQTNFLEYTVGMLYTPDFKQVLLIKKTKPQWQAGNWNFPGGKIEPGEPPRISVSREFREETNLRIPTNVWRAVGTIHNEGECKYRVLIFAGIYDAAIHGEVSSLTDELVSWHHTFALPTNLITNLTWLIPLGVNYLQKGNNPDKIIFVDIEYID